MASLDVAMTIKQIRGLLAGQMVIVSQVEEALIDGTGDIAPQEIPGMLWEMREKNAQAGVLMAEWDQAHNEGDVDNPEFPGEPIPEG